MGPWMYVLIALFFFSLLAGIIFLYSRFRRSRDSGNANSEREREQRLFRLYENLEDMMNALEEYVEEAKEEIRAEKEEILALKGMADLPEAPRDQQPHRENLQEQKQLKFEAHRPVDDAQFSVISLKSEQNKGGIYERKSGDRSNGADLKAFAKPGPEPEKKRKSGQSKIEDVRNLRQVGMNEENIARELGLSQGEVNLILGMLGK